MASKATNRVDVDIGGMWIHRPGEPSLRRGTLMHGPIYGGGSNALVLLDDDERAPVELHLSRVRMAAPDRHEFMWGFTVEKNARDCADALNEWDSHHRAEMRPDVGNDALPFDVWAIPRDEADAHAARSFTIGFAAARDRDGWDP